MDLTQYIASCIGDDEFPTQRILFLGGEVVAEFRNMRGASELSVVELGVHLFWNAATEQLTYSKPRMSGGERAVDLKTKDIWTNTLYIGDCHTHPYRRKMGPEARIGPSSGDYEEWWAYPPQHFKIALHFVVSSATIFLILQRKDTARSNHELGRAFGKVQPDTQALDAVKERCMDSEDFNRDYMKAYEAKTPDRKRDYAALREFEQKHFPGLASRFTEANLKMNVDLANQLRFEYYAGEMDEDSKALKECKLTLLSRLVYGNGAATTDFDEKKLVIH